MRPKVGQLPAAVVVAVDVVVRGATPAAAGAFAGGRLAEVRLAAGLLADGLAAAPGRGGLWAALQPATAMRLATASAAGSRDGRRDRRIAAVAVGSPDFQNMVRTVRQ